MKKRVFSYIFVILMISSMAMAYERVIPMAPNLVEVFYALGLGEKVSAVPEFTNYPKEALQKPSAGSYLYPSYETILRLKPDLIIVQGFFPSLSRFAGKHKIEIMSVNMDSLGSIYSGIVQIGKKFHIEERSFKLVSSIKKDLILIPEERKPLKVFICIGKSPGSLKQMSTPGRRSFISELIEYSGGLNIFHDMDKNYITISKEEVLKRSPDIIFDIVSSGENEESLHKLWKKLPLDAVKEGRVFFLKENYILIPGPRIVETARLFKHYIDLASKRDLKKTGLKPLSQGGAGK